MPKISVIIPVYNVEKYLERCINSVINQELEDIEIICINDGSLDKSGDICNEYSNKDNRIRVIHKNNEGVSIAKNLGVSLARGEYICFIDSDDYIDKDMLSEMYKLARNNSCQVIISGYKLVPSGEIIRPLYKLNKSMDPIEMISNNSLVHSHNDLCFSWRCLFNLNVIKSNNILFDNNIKIGEDFIFNLKVLSKCNKVYVTEKPFYNYNVANNTSVMRTSYKEYLEENLIKQYNEKKRLSQELGLYDITSYKKDLANYYINNMLPMIFKNIFNGCEKDKNLAIKRVLNYNMFRESFNEVGFSYKSTNYKEYIAYLILKFRIYPLVYKIINKQYRVN